MSRKHTHKYYRAHLKFEKVWACGLPGCYHFMPKHYEEMVVGRGSICWKCGEMFVLDPQNMKRDKPICDDCSMGDLIPDSTIIESEARVIKMESSQDELSKLCKRCMKNPRAGQSEYCMPCFLAV